MINKIVNQKNLSVIYLAGQTVNFQINSDDIKVSFSEGKKSTYTPSTISSKAISALQNTVLDKSGSNDSLKLAIFLLVPILGFLLSIIIIVILYWLVKITQKEQGVLIFLILFCLPFFICSILDLIFYFYNYAYFKKMSQLFDIVKETDFKEENPELFNQLNFIYNFQYIVLAFILIFILLCIIMGVIYFKYGQQDLKNLIILLIFLLSQLAFAIFLLIAYSKQKNKITINEKEEEEKIKKEEIEKEEIEI